MISVILVTYNSRLVLPACLTALERTVNAQQLELVFVDNDSADGTLEWLADYAKQPHLPFVHLSVTRLSANRGYAYANNRGIEAAHGDIILLLNPDTVVGADAIDTCARRLDNPIIGAVGCRLEMENGELDKACRRSFPTLWNSFTRLTGLSLLFPKWRWLSQYNLTHLDERGSYEVDSVSGAFCMLPQSVVAAVQGLDEDYFLYGEDLDLCYRVKRAGFKILYEGSVTTVHLKGGNGGKRSANSLWAFYAAMSLYYRKHHPHNHVGGLFVAAMTRCLYLFHRLRREPSARGPVGNSGKPLK